MSSEGGDANGTNKGLARARFPSLDYLGNCFKADTRLCICQNLCLLSGTYALGWRGMILVGARKEKGGCGETDKVGV